MIQMWSTSATVLLTSSPTESERVRLIDKLMQMTALPPGWSYGEGQPVTARAATVAEQYVTMASQLSLAADVFPNTDGGCAVAFYDRDERVEVSIDASGERLTLLAERGLGHDYENIMEPIENATREQVYREVCRLAEDIWKSFASSIYASINIVYDVFETPSTKTHLLVQNDLPQTAKADFRL